MSEDINGLNEQKILYETRSEEVQEILGKMPSWIIRYGVALIGIILFLLIYCSYLVRYPDVVFTQVEILSDNPPVSILSKKGGIIKKVIIAEQNTFVTAGTVLVELASSLDFEEVIKVKSLLRDLINKKISVSELPSGKFNLGVYQVEYNELLKYNESAKRNISNIEQTSEQKLVWRANELLNHLDAWETDYIIKTPISGSINLHKIMCVNQYIEASQNIMVIVPEIKNIIARGSIGSSDIGKIDIGQKVYIDLMSYPHNEFGYVEGNIYSICTAPIAGKFIFDIKLKNGLLTNRGVKILPKTEMQAIGEVLTKDKSLLSRFISEVK